MTEFSGIVTSEIEEMLEQVVKENFPEHPFQFPFQKEQFEVLIRNYLAMSQAFPYLQAGSQKELIFHTMENNIDVSTDIEVTSVVANFLCWDETGGNYILGKYGIEGLPQILNTKTYFHSNLLKHDIKHLINKDVTPEYSEVTKQYLFALYNGLSNLDPVVRCAYMVSFESHAERMITNLWNTIEKVFTVNKDDLLYFRTHVGGDDPAEPYHVATTVGMIEKVVPKKDLNRFFEEFKKAYSLHINWCQDILQ